MNRLLCSLDSERPRFGYGRYSRPLWDEQCRDAERIRRALRKAKIREFGKSGGFSVEQPAEDAGPFTVAAALKGDEDVDVVMPPSSGRWRPRNRPSTGGRAGGRSWIRWSRRSVRCWRSSRTCRPRSSPSGSAGVVR